MNKLHITDEQVDKILERFYGEMEVDDRVALKLALEAEFPEPSVQELLSDEERSARHDDPQQPAAFGPLIVTEDDAEEINYAKDIREALQSFVDRHSIKPIAFADKTPEEGQEILYWSKCLKCWSGAWKFEKAISDIEDTHWLPASALPIPDPTVVDAKEAAKEKAWDQWKHNVSRSHFDQIWFSAQQAGGAK